MSSNRQMFRIFQNQGEDWDPSAEKGTPRTQSLYSGKIRCNYRRLGVVPIIIYQEIENFASGPDWVGEL